MAINWSNPVLRAILRPSRHLFAGIAGGVCAGFVLIGTASAADEKLADPQCKTVACLNAQDEAIAQKLIQGNRARDPACMTAECVNTRERLRVEDARKAREDLAEARSKLAEWRLKRVQLESRQAQRRSVPRDTWPEIMNNSMLQYLRQTLFDDEQEIATARTMATEISKLVATGAIPVALGVDADDGADAMAPSIRVYEKERDIARLKINYEMDLIEAKMDLELLRAIEQELIWEDKVKDLVG